MRHNKKKVLLIGPSGNGKSFCISRLSEYFNTLDMDLMINTKKEYSNDELDILYYRILKHNSIIIGISVLRKFLQLLLQKKFDRSLRNDGFFIVYLRSENPETHRTRLTAKPALGRERSLATIEMILRSANTIDQICGQLSDIIVPVDSLSKEALITRIKSIANRILNRNKEECSMDIEYLSQPEYTSRTAELAGKHWASAGSRWSYHSLSVLWAKELELEDPKSVLEIGTMGVQIVKGSDCMDYDAARNNKDWLLADYKPDYVHDARSLPWPFEDNQYELTIALRVYHHLTPDQQQCFLEARRVTKNLIIVVPSRKIHPRGIDRQQLVDWNNGVEPFKEKHFEGALGDAYWFSWN